MAPNNAEEAPEAETFCSLIYMPRKLLINPLKLMAPNVIADMTSCSHIQ